MGAVETGSRGSETIAEITIRASRLPFGLPIYANTNSPDIPPSTRSHLWEVTSAEGLSSKTIASDTSLGKLESMTIRSYSPTDCLERLAIRTDSPSFISVRACKTLQDVAGVMIAVVTTGPRLGANSCTLVVFATDSSVPRHIVLDLPSEVQGDGPLALQSDESYHISSSDRPWSSALQLNIAPGGPFAKFLPMFNFDGLRLGKVSKTLWIAAAGAVGSDFGEPELQQSDHIGHHSEDDADKLGSITPDLDIAPSAEHRPASPPKPNFASSAAPSFPSSGLWSIFRFFRKVVASIFGWLFRTPSPKAATAAGEPTILSHNENANGQLPSAPSAVHSDDTDDDTDYETRTPADDHTPLLQVSRSHLPDLALR